MGLKKIVINNFKSYGGELEVPFNGLPSAAIVGPNGSGKSNMLDAICFVIGMDISQLRAKSIDNLVHKSNIGSMFVEAEVELPDSESESVLFRRTVDEFLVDNVPVTQEVYTDKWAEVNVLPGAGNCVVMQGDIDKLTRSEPKDLAWLIESLQPASTLREVIDDRDEYETIQKQLEEAAQESRKFLSARRTAQAKMDEAENLTASRDKLESMKSQLAKLKARRKALAIAEKRSTLNALKRKIQEAHSEVVSTRTEVELMDADTKRLRSDYARKRKQLQLARNAEQEAAEAITAAEAELVPLERKHAAIETELRLQVPDLKYAEENAINAKKELDAAASALQLLDRTREREQIQEDTAMAGAEFPSRELQDLWNKTNSEFVSETVLQQDVLDRLKQRSESAQRKLLEAERQAEDHESEVRAAASRLRQQELRVQQLESLLEERRTQQQDRREELEQIAESLQSLRKEQRETSDKLRELNQKVKAADGNKRALAQRHRLLDTVERLRRAHPGVYDLLGSLITPLEEKYSIALERALGKNADAVVVDSVETAMACITQARRERLGILEFLPLNDLQSRDLASSRALLARQSALGKEVNLMLDCGHFEQRFRPAVLYALGDTAFVPTFSEGFDLRHSGAKMRIIDSQGSVISQNNTISTSFGGDSSQKSNLSDRSLAIMQRKIMSYSEKLKAGANEETDLEDREIRVSSNIDRCLKIIENAETELDVARQKLDSVLRSYEYLQSQSKDHVATVTSANEVFSQAQEEYQQQKDQLNKERGVMFKDFIARAGGTLAEWDNRFAIGASRITELANKRKSLEERLKAAQDQLDLAQTQLNRYHQRQHVLESAEQKIAAELAVANNELNAARHKLERAQSRVSALRSESESRSDEMGAAESSIEEARTRVAIAEREEHRRAMALAAQIENNEINENDDSDDDAENLEVQGDDDEDESNASSRKARRNRRTRASVAAVSSNKRGRSGNVSKSSKNNDQFDESETLSLDRLDSKIRDLKAEIEPLATLMNMMKAAKSRGEKEAIRASQICADLDKTTEALRKTHDELSVRFNELKELRANRFNSVFSELQLNLSSIYSDLIGGDAQAKLTIVQGDVPFEGVDFQAMPPNKAFTPVSQLSGGERSMAALSLLFACQRLHPAPFVVLDEVDAALDFENVGTIARYIQLNCASTQFIMVSLKQRLFQTASNLIGVYKQKVTSEILTIEL